MRTTLANKACVPCRGGVSPLQGEDVQQLLRELGNGWDAIRDHHLEKHYTFKNFRQALDFTNVVSEIAEQQGHHPEITLAWGKVTVRIWTHKIDGLTESDFVLAAKTDRALPQVHVKSA